MTIGSDLTSTNSIIVSPAMNKQTKPFYLVGDANALHSLIAINGKVNSAEFRGWPPESVMLIVSGKRSPNNPAMWQFRIKPVTASAHIAVIDPNDLTASNLYRIRESTDFSFIESITAAP